MQFKSAMVSLDLGEGSLAAAALNDGSVHILNVDTGQIVYELSTGEPGSGTTPTGKNELVRARFAPGGKLLAVSHGDLISIYDVDTWREIKVLKPENDPSIPNVTSPSSAPVGYLQMVITDFSFTVDGHNIVAAYCHVGCSVGAIFYGIRSKFVGSDPIRLWDVDNKKIIWEHPSAQTEVPERVVASRDGKLFAVVSYTLLGDERSIRMYDLRTGRELYALPRFSSNLPPANVLFTRDSKQFVTASRQASKGHGKSHKDYCERMHLGIYQAETGDVISEINNSNGALEIADLSLDDHWLAASTCMTPGFQLWDFRTQRAV
jgi:WD40 repeat protein